MTTCQCQPWKKQRKSRSSSQEFESFIMNNLSFYILCVNQLLLILISGGSNSLTEGSTYSGAKRRVKRVMDGTPKPTTTAAPLTSEEERERKFGTESPHLHDYPDNIYKSPEVRKGEWTGNPIPKKNTKNVTKTEKTKSSSNKKPNPDKNNNNKDPAPTLIESLLGGL